MQIYDIESSYQHSTFIPMTHESIDKLNYAQRERLVFIDFCLEYYGVVARADLVQQFQTGLASCSRDLTLYRELAPNNAELVHQTKQYMRTDSFTPLFSHDADQALNQLIKGHGASLQRNDSQVCFDAVRLTQPKQSIVAALMRAIHNSQAIQCRYHSLSSGAGNRTIIPHVIINNGHRWHVRAFDRKTNSFRDFVCSRFTKIEHSETPPKTSECSSFDDAWNTIINLEIGVHPQIKHPKAIELDYEMTQGKLNIEVRSALVGYLLTQWNVDCSENGSLNAAQYQLHLKNTDVLSGLESIELFPGCNQ
ncbi:WYL domain-containing protein [Photobacterium leiognathi]|uniref:WYL domain-containing protein n=1 Tax=Photobacterium leiognathi TaxID=553611 RepID=UPI0027390B11|nr:WYL domain-containing protein [Photobacterium leiognathi]